MTAGSARRATSCAAPPTAAGGGSATRASATATQAGSVRRASDYSARARAQATGIAQKVGCASATRAGRTVTVRSGAASSTARETPPMGRAMGCASTAAASAPMAGRGPDGCGEMACPGMHGRLCSEHGLCEGETGKCVCVRSYLTAITRTRSQRCSCMAPAAYRPAHARTRALVSIPRSTALLWLAALQGSLLPATERLATRIESATVRFCHERPNACVRRSVCSRCHATATLAPGAWSIVRRKPRG